MQRRSLLKMGALSVARAYTGAFTLGSQEVSAAGRGVKRVLLVTKCHLDVGFTQTQALVMRKYFDVYYPQAMETAARLRNEGGDRYVWTTGSWLLWEYLEQASPTSRRAMEEALAAGDITWHALPFSWQTEMLDRSMIEGAMGFSADLDRRFGRKTSGAKTRFYGSFGCHTARKQTGSSWSWRLRMRRRLPAGTSHGRSGCMSNCGCRRMRRGLS